LSQLNKLVLISESREKAGNSNSAVTFKQDGELTPAFPPVYSTFGTPEAYFGMMPWRTGRQISQIPKFRDEDRLTNILLLFQIR
jgi:hypothetical protein